MSPEMARRQSASGGGGRDPRVGVYTSQQVAQAQQLKHARAAQNQQQQLRALAQQGPALAASSSSSPAAGGGGGGGGGGGELRPEVGINWMPDADRVMAEQWLAQRKPGCYLVLYRFYSPFCCIVVIIIVVVVVVV
jgi:hypothetical protein